MEEKIVYFEKPGKENTNEVIERVLERARLRHIGRIVVASTRGDTVKSFSAAVEDKDIKLVVVPWQFGFKGKENPFPKELVRELQEKKHSVYFGTMLFVLDSRIQYRNHARKCGVVQYNVDQNQLAGCNLLRQVVSLRSFFSQFLNILRIRLQYFFLSK